MNDKVWKACTAVAAILMAATAVVSAALGGCDAALECTSGACVPMKCHWCFVAVLVESVAACVVALFGLAQKTLEGRRAVAFAVIVFALAMLAECYLAIGVCGATGMACHTTRLVVTVLVVLAAVAAAAGFAKADPEADKKPKMKL